MPTFKPDDLDLGGFLSTVSQACFAALDRKGLELTFTPGYDPVHIISGLRMFAQVLEDLLKMSPEDQARTRKFQQRLAGLTDQFLTDMQKKMEQDPTVEGLNPVEDLFMGLTDAVEEKDADEDGVGI